METDKQILHCFNMSTYMSIYKLITHVRVFPGLFRHGGTSAGGQSVNEGDSCMGDLTLIDYIMN